MTTIQQEIAQLQVEFEGLVEAWNTLSQSDRRREWCRYLDLTDEGGAGWHRFARLLINCFCEGWCPIDGMERNADGELGPFVRVAA